MPIQAWLDSSGRPVRMVMTLDAGADVGKMRSTMDIVGYGKPVTVQRAPGRSDRGAVRAQDELMALRNRLAGATIALVVVAALAIFVLGAPSAGPLAQAADDLKGQRVKLKYQLSVIEDGRSGRRSAPTASPRPTARAARLQVTYIVPGEDDVRGRCSRSARTSG